MPNILDASGLQTATREELVTQFTTAFQTIYGSDINLDSDTPDGQMMNIFIQSVLDLQDLLTQIYNSFDPDNAIGNVLDQRVSINGIQRQAGTYTVTNITVVTSQALNLPGLDQNGIQPFTVQDLAGNNWMLEESQNIGAAGTYVYSFRAEFPGEVLTTINTITIPVTIILGVVSVNNPTTYTTLGINEESDGVLKVRRQKSVSLASQGYLASLLAALENINGVVDAFIYENTTGATDGDGVPGHSIWVIVGGSGTAAEIAQAIYTKRNAGCGMFGEQEYTITQVDGSPFVVKWDNVEAQNLFTKFEATSINGTDLPNIAAILDQLPTLFAPTVNEEVNINRLATLVQQIDSNTLVTNAGFSTGLIEVYDLSGVAASGTFKVKYNGNESAAINWNDAIGTIQSKVQAVTGLSEALVTGSIAGSSLTFNLEALESAASLITITSNSLQTGGAVPIEFVLEDNFTNTLSPTTKNKQFAVSSSQIIITPMILLPETVTLDASTGEQTFVAYGGYGEKSYSFDTNNSGGTIDASTGEYVAGATPDVVDTILVTDEFGNTATAAVTVV